MIRKNIVRKIILEEILKNIERKKSLNEVSPALAAAVATVAGVAAGVEVAMASFIDDPNGAKVDKLTTHTQQNNIYLVLKEIIDKIEDVQIINDSDAKNLVQRLKSATISQFGTDEDEIKKVIEDSDTQINFAKVAVQFHTLTGKSFKDVYRDELAGGDEIFGTEFLKDQDEYVITPLLTLPFIKIGNNSLSEEEFLKLLEEAKKNTSSDEAQCNPPATLSTPYFTNAVKVMNDYAKNKKIEGWVDGPEKETWEEGSHQKCWELFVGHVFANQPKFKEYAGNLTNGGKTWKEVSDVLRPDHPGYTYNKRGFLAFCLDAYCDETKHGDESPPSSGGGVRRGGSPRSDASSDNYTDRRKATRSSLMDNVTINLNQTGKDFGRSKFSLRSGRDIDETFAQSILNFASQEALNKGMSKSSISFYMNLNNDGDKVESIDRIKFDGSLRNLKKRERKIEQAILDIARGMIFPASGPYSKEGDFDSNKRGKRKAIFVTFTFEAGRYL